MVTEQMMHFTVVFFGIVQQDVNIDSTYKGGALLKSLTKRSVGPFTGGSKQAYMKYSTTFSGSKLEHLGNNVGVGV